MLAEIYRLAYKTENGLGCDAEESLCLGFVAFASKAIFATADLSLTVSPGDRVGVAVGWDSGMPLCPGWLSSDGFEVRSAAEAIAGMEKLQAEMEVFARGDDYDTRN